MTTHIPSRTSYFRERIREHERFNAFISMTTEEGDGPCVAVKDVIDVAGVPTTGGGVVLPELPAAKDAAVVASIREHGCAVIGKTNLHEWAFGPTNVNPHYGAVLNPHDPARISGGSSGGSAAAVALGLCDWAIGTDTGGSIRIPASLCGVVGFKPTRGRIATGGVVPLSRTLDVVGPMAPDVRGAARGFETMTGTAFELDVAPIESFRLAYPAGWADDLDRPTAAVWREISVSLIEIPFPERATVAAPGRVVLYREAFDYHRPWFEEQPHRYGDDVRGYLNEGSKIADDEYEAALAGLANQTDAVETALERWDAVVLPATARVAPPLRDLEDVREPLTRFTRPFNASGHPAIAIPAPSNGLPVGLQVVGHVGEDERVLAIAAAVEARLASQGAVGGRR